VQAVVEALPPVEPKPEDYRVADSTVLTRVDSFEPDPWRVHNTDICAAHGCRVWSEYVMERLCNALVHLDPTTDRYSALLYEGWLTPEAQKGYVERMTHAAHRPTVRHGRPFPKIARGRDYTISTDALLSAYQIVAEEGFFEEMAAPLMVVGPEVYTGLLRSDEFINRIYRTDRDDALNVWGYKDAYPIGKVFGMPVARSSFVNGDLAVIRSVQGREIDVNLLSLGRQRA
jgi:hypothetical protein